jgi:hypothetical protein
MTGFSQASVREKGEQLMGWAQVSHPDGESGRALPAQEAARYAPDRLAKAAELS